MITAARRVEWSIKCHGRFRKFDVHGIVSSNSVHFKEKNPNIGTERISMAHTYSFNVMIPLCSSWSHMIGAYSWMYAASRIRKRLGFGSRCRIVVFSTRSALVISLPWTSLECSAMPLVWRCVVSRRDRVFRVCPMCEENSTKKGKALEEKH